MLSKREEQNERRETLMNNARVKGSTFSQFAESEAATSLGRFGAIRALSGGFEMADIIPLHRDDDDDEPIEQTLARWKAAMPLTYHYGERTLDDAIEYIHGRRDLDFVVAMNRRAIDGLVVLYDIAATPDERKRMRKDFREIMARQRSARLAPYLAELHAPLRTRLREHKMYVICGLDPPDPDERRKGKRDDAA